ncbi:MAG: T9SS type A sorting domain-containing protein [Candidatus Latescibacterota bacterium]|nr:MAG: T9SS type A sorting domain-containing protein [Candidatus Latescibacterota bacterium]
MKSHACVAIFIGVLLAAISVSAQEPVHIWSGGYGDSGLDYGEAIAVDPVGDIVIAGYFYNTIDFGGGLRTSAGGADIFVAKFDPWGQHLWSHRFGGTNNQHSYAVTTDPDGNVIVAGYFEDTVNFGSGLMTSAGSTDICVAKLDPNGNPLWSTRYGDSSPQYAFAVATDGSGNIYIAGDFLGTVDFGGGPWTATSNYDIYVAKLAGSNGAHVWSIAFPGNDHDSAESITVDHAGNVLLTGFFAGTVNFGGGVLSSAGSSDIYLAKLGDGGAHVWSKRFGDASHQYGEGVAVDEGGSPVLIAEFDGTTNFGGGNLTSGGQWDIAVAKFDVDGNHVWSNRYGGADEQRPRGVGVGPEGHITLTGHFESTVDFGGGSLTSAGNNDVFIARLDPDGNHQWSWRYGDSDTQYSEAVAVEPGGGLAIVGTNHGVIEFDGYIPWFSNGMGDVFVARFAEPPVGTCAGALLHLDPDATVDYSSYANTELGIYISALENFEICALGIGMLPPNPVPMVAKVYEANGTSRGSLVAIGEFMAAGQGIGVYYVPINYLLEACHDYDIAIEFGTPGAILYFSEYDFSYPYDVGGVIRVRKAEQWGSTMIDDLPAFAVIGSAVGHREYADLGPPETSWYPSTDAQTERGVYITAKKTIKVWALHWEADFAVTPVTVIARIYEANGTTRGMLLASGAAVAETSGMTMHTIPISAVLEEGKDYDLVVEFESAWWASIGEGSITLPYDVGDIITVRDGEQGGNAANTILTHFAIDWSEGVAGAPFALGKSAEGYPPPNSTTISNTNYGLYVTSLADQSIFSLGWEADVQPGDTLYAWVFNASGISRGVLESEGSVICGAEGMRWHDIPVAAEFHSSLDYNIEVGFGQVNEWRYWEDYTGMPYVAYGLFSVYSSSQGGSPNFHRLPHMRVNACNAVGTGIMDTPGQTPRFTLGAPQPNPAASSTLIPFSLDEDGPVTITLYDVAGRRVAVLLDNEPRPAGDGSVALDAGKLPAGVYFVKMKNGQKSVSRKITIVR